MIELSVLDRVRQFLPQLAESNASLSGRDQHELDIENVGSGGSYYIEMVIGFQSLQPPQLISRRTLD